MPVVVRAHCMLFLVDVGFLGFQVLGFTGSQLPAVYSLRDAILLIVLTLRDRRRFVRTRRGRAGIGLLCKCRRYAKSNDGRRTQNKSACLHDDFPPSGLVLILSVSPRELLRRPYDSWNTSWGGKLRCGCVYNARRPICRP